MFRSRFSLCALTLAMGIAVGAQAQATGLLYECDVPPPANDLGWLPQKLAIVFQDDGTVRVADSVSLHFDRPPAKARARKSGSVIRLNWTLNGVEDSASTYIAALSFFAKLNMADNSIQLTASFPRTPQRWRSTGTCKQHEK